MTPAKRQRPEKSVSQCKAGADEPCNETRAELTVIPFSSVTVIVNSDSGDGAGACAAAKAWATRVTPRMIEKMCIRSNDYRKAKPSPLGLKMGCCDRSHGHATGRRLI